MKKLLLTEDGSYTVVFDQFQETYHSKYGAIQESQTVFIDAGLNYLSQQLGRKKLSVLEIGFGTGLNAFMTYIESCKQDLEIEYLGLEAYPIGAELAAGLNYHQLLEAENEHAAFLQMHQSLGQRQEICPHFALTVLEQDFETWQAPNAHFDLIYYDAFAPSAQPQLWEEPMMRKMYQTLKPGGVLTTYSAKGAFKRLLKDLGFELHSLPGPKGKREMTRAIKPS